MPNMINSFVYMKISSEIAQKVIGNLNKHKRTNENYKIICIKLISKEISVF